MYAEWGPGEAGGVARLGKPSVLAPLTFPFSSFAPRDVLWSIKPSWRSLAYQRKSEVQDCTCSAAHQQALHFPPFASFSRMLRAACWALRSHKLR